MAFEIFISLLLFVCILTIIGVLNALFAINDILGNIYKEYVASKEKEKDKEIL